MASKKEQKQPTASSSVQGVCSSLDELMLAALASGGEQMETGRYLVTFKDGAGAAGLRALGAQGLQVADARDFQDQAVRLESIGGADAVLFPEIGVALVGGGAAQAAGVSAYAEIAADSAIASIDPEYFVFAEPDFSVCQNNFFGAATGSLGQSWRGFGSADESTVGSYLRGFAHAAQTIAQDLGASEQLAPRYNAEAQMLGATWGLNACRVPPSVRSGAGIRVAILDTGLDLGHPDFAGRSIVSQTFVGQPVQDIYFHGTHMIGTVCGPQSPADTTPRYGIAWRSSIFVGKILNNSGFSVGGSVLNGMNWAIANRCAVILSPIGMQSPVQAAYTAMGQAALNNGCLIIAGAGHSASNNVGAPANSPTIMSVAALDSNLTPSGFSNFGKIEIAAPGRDVFSSAPRPSQYRIISGTATAAAHVAGCAVLWAETSPSLRGIHLWRKLQTTARRLPFPATRVGAGLVQSP